MRVRCGLAIEVHRHEKTDHEFVTGFGAMHKVVRRLEYRQDGLLKARTAVTRGWLPEEVTQVETGALVRSESSVVLTMN